MTKKPERTVPFFNYSHVFTSQEEKLLSIIKSVGERGAFIMQNDLKQFENNLAEFCKVKYAVGVANATDALEMLISACDIGTGDEVIFCSHTMIATASAIHINGATPVPVEAGWDHLIDPDSIKNAVTTKTKAIMPTQLNGRVANMIDIRKIAEDHGLLIIEDSAQALGAKYKNQAAGTFGAGGCISFYPAKILGCFGDGGMVLCNDEIIYNKLLLMRDHGRDPISGDVVLWGRNSRLDNLQAAFLNYQFENYSSTITRRREIAGQYHSQLREIEKLVLPPAPVERQDHYDVFQNYEIEAENRDDLKLFLSKNGIGTLVQWGGKAVHQFKKLGFSQSLPFTESLMSRMLMLPINMSITNSEVEYVSGKVREFYGK